MKIILRGCIEGERKQLFFKKKILTRVYAFFNDLERRREEGRERERERARGPSVASSAP